MAAFDSFSDSPEKIRIEGQEITLEFDQITASTGRITWNIPPPANGCTSGTSAYCGMLVTLDTKPTTIVSAPVDGTQYTADPTGDTDLHVGDKIDTALVIGAFYEGVKKASGQTLTTTFDITGLNETTAYFISGYAVDCQNRYHTQGTSGFSQPLGSGATPDTAGSQTLTMSGDGVLLTDGTGLTLGQNCQLIVEIDGQEYTITINGDDAQTYQELIEAINNQIELLTPAPQGPVPPGTGTYYYDATNKKLFQWDGFQLNEQPLLSEPTDPTALAVGDTWYDTVNNILNEWDGTVWVPVPDTTIIRFNKDLTVNANLNTTDFWYQNTVTPHAYSWCGNVWCEQVLFPQEADPSLGSTVNCGSYWFNPDDNFLRHWNELNMAWETTDAIYWDIDPSATGSPGLLAGSYWFNETTQKLFQWDTPVINIWNDIGFGYQDIILTNASGPYTNDTVFLTDGEYLETVLINGEEVTLRLTICNATEGKLVNILKELNAQLALATNPMSISLRSDGLALRLISASINAPAIQSPGSPVIVGTLFTSFLDFSAFGVSTTGILTTVGTEPTTPIANQYWVDTTNEDVFLRNAANSGWVRQCAIFFTKDPTDRNSCDLWWNSETDVLNIWDEVAGIWVAVSSFFMTTTDPAGLQLVNINDTWFQPSTQILRSWDGNAWQVVNTVIYMTDPTDPAVDDIWFDATTNIWQKWNGTAWIPFNPIESPVNPSQATIPTGQFWFDEMTNVISMWNGTNWVPIIFSTTNPTPSTGSLWYNTTDNTLNTWNGTTWVNTPGLAELSLFPTGNLVLTSSTTGGTSTIVINSSSTLLNKLTDFSSLNPPICGTDGLSGEPSYLELGIGTDGSSDERRKLHDTIRRLLGYPIVEVEVDKEAIDIAVNIALEEFRRLSSGAYRRGFMKLPIIGGVQRYQLTNKGTNGAGIVEPDGSFTGYNEIVNVMGVYRTTSAFMTSAHGSGIFGQVVLQHLYNMGTFDLLSFHMVSEYIEQLEHLFASRITFNWNETSRILWLQQVFSQNELAVMDVSVERTEQDLFTDRYVGRWLERYTLAHTKEILSQIRGKFSTINAAGGAVTLNAAELYSQSIDEKQALHQEVADYVVQNVEEYGQGCEFVIG